MRVGPWRGCYLHEPLLQLRLLLDERAVLLQVGAQEQAQVLDEVLLIVRAFFVRFLDVRCERQHLYNQNQTHSDYQSLYFQ